jgi:sulfate adenylyltransferase subunit 2
VPSSSRHPTIQEVALDGRAWSAKKLFDELQGSPTGTSLRTVLRTLADEWGGLIVDSLESVRNASGEPINSLITPAIVEWVSKKRKPLEILQLVTFNGVDVVILTNSKGRLIWQAVSTESGGVHRAIRHVVDLQGGKLCLLPHGSIRHSLEETDLPEGVINLASLLPPEPFMPDLGRPRLPSGEHSYLDDLERESINVIREAVASAQKPCMLFSMGKDSMVMLTLAKKAFAPGPVPFPLVVIDTRWKFQAMYRFREQLQRDPSLSVIVYINPEAIERDVNPFDFGSATHTDITKTQALKNVLDDHQFDFVFGGARRDEEKSRAKERIFSVRNASHGWDPKKQRPELWNLYNTALVEGQSMRVFPLSNWTELDIWRYLERETVDLVPLYFAALRPFVLRNDALIMVDDDRFPLEEGEKVHIDHVRFRTLGCYPLTGGTLSAATTLRDIVEELEKSNISERSSRVIDFDQGASMEQKKKDGYF